jgi:hypothetical protein
MESLLEEKEKNLSLFCTVGQNAIELLNTIPLYNGSWMSLLQKLSKGTDPIELSEYLTHGSEDNVWKSLEKVESLNSNDIELPLFCEKKKESKKDLVYERQEKEAEDFLVNCTREDANNHRLYTTESVTKLYDEYRGSVPDPISLESFSNTYSSLRILREKHCKHDIYTCPKCNDQLPLARQLVEQLEPTSPDYERTKEIYEKLLSHQERWHIQTDSFYALWNNPPDDTIVLAEE